MHLYVVKKLNVTLILLISIKITLRHLIIMKSFTDCIIC